MKWKPKEIQTLEKLQAAGFPLDQRALKKAQTACRGLVITSIGNPCEDVIYVHASGGMSLSVAVAIENVAERGIRIVEIRPQIPWSDDGFRWLKRRSARELNERGGYTFPPFDSYGFDPAVVLNHRFGRNFKLAPGEDCEGLLLGESVWPVPDTYLDRAKVPVQLLFLVDNGQTFGTWVTLHVQPPKVPTICKSQRRAVFA